MKRTAICRRISAKSVQQSTMEYIPDLSEIQSDFLAKQVADAPSISICHFMRSSLEAEGDARTIEKKIVSAAGMNIEAGLLVRCLEAVNALAENDHPWNYQSLHQVIKAHLHSD
ncbi:uncharacterized protein LOC111266681 isoform X2 [Varroa jacobsoni]|uniref:uncharacterized protein LOC111266681 isoform X2 n=1 Tax=Varroa jacobsoni TaxID=62625 RepID=UPI000BF2F8AC|nr:uncharacterized protein LOC111266681 isoform X2 [Varroa jacobsoni]